MEMASLAGETSSGEVGWGRAWAVEHPASGNVTGHGTGVGIATRWVDLGLRIIENVLIGLDCTLSPTIGHSLMVQLTREEEVTGIAVLR